jgi:hypothetical protein
MGVWRGPADSEERFGSFYKPSPNADDVGRLQAGLIEMGRMMGGGRETRIKTISANTKALRMAEV